LELVIIDLCGLADTNLSTFKMNLNYFNFHNFLLTFDRNMLIFSRLLVSSVKQSSLGQSILQKYKLYRSYINQCHGTALTMWLQSNLPIFL
jgi:hypothetical protein